MIITDTRQSAINLNRDEIKQLMATLNKYKINIAKCEHIESQTKYDSAYRYAYSLNPGNSFEEYVSRVELTMVNIAIQLDHFMEMARVYDMYKCMKQMHPRDISEMELMVELGRDGKL